MSKSGECDTVPRMSPQELLQREKTDFDLTLPAAAPTTEFQTSEQRLHAEIATFIEEELQNIQLPLHVRVAKGFRLAAKLRLVGDDAVTLAQNFDVFESNPVDEWPNALQELYASGFSPAVVIDILQSETSARAFEMLSAIKEQHPTAPIQLSALMLAVSASQGTGDYNTYLNNRFLALQAVPIQLQTLVVLDIAAFTAVYESIYQVLSNVLNVSIVSTVVHSARLEDLFIKSMQVAGYHAAVGAYTTKQEHQSLNPSAVLPHPMDLWRAATQPRYSPQGGSYTRTFHGFMGEERRRLFKLLVAQEYGVALEKLRAVSVKFPQVVQAQYLDRAEGVGEQWVV